MIKKIWPALILMIILLSCAAQKSGRVSMEEEILKYTNRFREKYDLSPLKLNEFINGEALHHSSDMASGRVAFGHGGFAQRTNNLRSKLGMVATGENVAYGKLSAKEVVDIWINSPPHRKNLLGNFTTVGIGVSKDRNGLLYFTQLFAR